METSPLPPSIAALDWQASTLLNGIRRLVTPSPQSADQLDIENVREAQADRESSRSRPPSQAENRNAEDGWPPPDPTDEGLPPSRTSGGLDLWA